MSIISAGLKYIARTVSDAILSHDIKVAKNKAYNATGKAMSKAGRNGSYINGSATYRKNYNSYIAKAKTRHSNRGKFIYEV